MSSYREERVVSETDDGVGVGGPGGPVGPRRGNPALVIGAIVIALLILGMVLFLSQGGNDNDGDDGVRVTVPSEFDQDDNNDGGDNNNNEDDTTETTR